MSPFWHFRVKSSGADLEGGEGGAPGDDVAGDEGGDEGEGEVPEGEAEAVAGVHGLVAEEEVLLEVHGVDGEDDLKGGGGDLVTSGGAAKRTRHLSAPNQNC